MILFPVCSESAIYDTTGHDVAHVERVLHLARYIADSEQTGNKIIIELASLLHDTVEIIHLNELLKIINLK